MIFAGYNFKAFFYYQLLEAYRFTISLLLLLWKKAFNISQLHCLDKNQSQVICEHLKAFFLSLPVWCSGASMTSVTQELLMTCFIQLVSLVMRV